MKKKRWLVRVYPCDDGGMDDIDWGGLRRAVRLGRERIRYCPY